MRRRRSIANVVVFIIGASVGVSVQDIPRSRHPAFRGGVDLVPLQVTVTDRSGRHVTDLTRDDFLVLEDGVKQDLAFFGDTGIPLALALLLDTSASMTGKLATAQEAAIGFARRLEPRDVATVVDFDTRVQILHGFTNDAVALEQAIGRTRAGGATALYNAVYVAVREFKKLRPERQTLSPSRRAVIVLSDGEDTSSLMTFEDVLDAAVRSDTVIYTIGIGLGETSSRESLEETRFILRRLAQQTGGRAFFPLDAADLSGVYGDIREELSSQYLLAYQSSNARRDAGWRRITVRVTRTGLGVRTRPGYYAPSR